MGTEVKSKAPQRFDAVQSLRFLCFMVVFGVHAGFFGAVTAAEVLEIFIVMSGFMMIYVYKDRELSCNPWKNFKFAIGKIGKLYPLHAITTTLQWIPTIWLYFAPYIGMISLGAFSLNMLKMFYPEYLLHMGLLHAWVPNETVNFMFNGPSWYLSATLFLYFMFPWVLKLIKSIKTRHGLVMLGIGTLLVMYLIAYFSHIYGSPDFYRWITIHCPVMKLGDFILGCVLGKMYADWKQQGTEESYSKLKWTIIEIIAVACVIGFEYLFQATVRCNSIIFDGESFYSTVGFNVIAVALVLLFILNRGYVTKIIGNKVFVYLGDISAYTYLTHYIFTIIWSNAVLIYEIDNTGWIKWTAIIIEFILTTATGALCFYLAKRSAAKKKQKAMMKKQAA